MSLDLAPTPRRWAYAQLCRRWFAHYPDPFLAETSNHIAGMALVPEEEKARLKWLADTMLCGGDIVRGYSRQSWPIACSLYWQSLPLRRYWRAPPTTMDRQQAHLNLAETLIAAAGAFSPASAVSARQALKHLPPGIPNPSILVYIDGGVAFWWQADYGQAVFVKFLPNGDLLYQYMNGDDNPLWSYPRWKGMIDGWNPGWPQGILDVLRVLYGRETRRS